MPGKVRRSWILQTRIASELPAGESGEIRRCRSRGRTRRSDNCQARARPPLWPAERRSFKLALVDNSPVMPRIAVLRSRLDLALQLAISDIEDGQIPDPLRHAELDWRQDQLLDRLTRRLRVGTYRPEPPARVSLPKSEFADRPGKRIAVQDLAVVFYAVLAMAEQFEDRLRAGVTAYRVRRIKPLVSAKRRYVLPRYLRRRFNVVDPWYDAWPKFQKRLQAEYALGRRFVGRSDITAFYESIDIDVLRAVLTAEGTKRLRPLVHLLADVYEAWSAVDVYSLGLKRGIPQGTQTSGVVANYFLMPFDNALSKHARAKNLTWFRYSDDLRLVGRDREAVRLGLRMVGEELSRLNLIQHAGKTDILTGRRARDELFDRRPARIEKIRHRLAGAPRPRTVRAAIRELDLIRATVPPNGAKDKLASRTLAMLYGAYGLAGSDKLLSRWRRDLIAEPYRAETILGYVRGFLNRPGRVNELARLIDERREKATDWEVALLLRSLRQAHRLPTFGVNLISSISRSRRCNWYVRQQAICGIGWFSLERSLRSLVLGFEHEWDDEVKRAIVAQSFLLDSAFEVAWLTELARTEPVSVSRMANFLLVSWLRSQ